MSEYSSEYLALMKEGNERGHVYVIGGFDMEMSDHVPGQSKVRASATRTTCCFSSTARVGCSAPSRPT